MSRILTMRNKLVNGELEAALEDIIDYLEERENDTNPRKNIPKLSK